ncbi:hypothetical protein [Tenacibaculum sp. UWU-22]|uniref:hypothetical protein n=1 Tax=Tenacibaculum sp. UWU-22 TaxID=3234187 RepID=UPI0034DB67B9
MKSKLLIFYIFFWGCINITNAQEQQVTPEFPNTIEGQFQKLYKKSGSYQIYKVIKKDLFLTLQKNVLDSISAIESDAVLKQKTINKQQETITSLKSEISKLNESLTTSMTKENSISLLGLQLSKAAYNTILWGIISLLLFGLILFIYRFNNSNYLTKQAKKSLTEVELELEQHRKKSLEKEQKLRRKLQDEINKQRGV